MSDEKKTYPMVLYQHVPPPVWLTPPIESERQIEYIVFGRNWNITRTPAISTSWLMAILDDENW